MTPLLPGGLWAVHISDGVLADPWWIGGFALAGLLALFGAWRIRDEEIPQTALMTAAFFVASLIPVPTFVGSHVHLLLTGLVGVVLGRRAALAIPVGLFLQAALFGHGGLTALGVNSCVMALPAIFAWQLFGLFQRLPWLCRPWFRGVLVGISSLTWTLGVIYSAALLVAGGFGHLSVPFHLAAVTCAVALSALAAWGERRLENAPEFPLGLLVGEAAVLATVLLQCLVLRWGAQPLPGSQEAWAVVALVTFVAHLPVAVVEGVVLGFTVGFLARVKPELLGWIAAEKAECPADAIP
jgi:cobalt/nickel transport system permease protein